MIFESATNLIIRGFYALHDSKTPVIVGVITVTINVVLASIAVPILHLPIWGLALAMAVADTIYAVVLMILLNIKTQGFPMYDLLMPAFKMFIAATLTGVSLYVPMKLLDQLVFDTTRTYPLILLTGTATIIGLSVYLFLTWVLDIKELASFLTIFTKIKRLLIATEKEVADVVTTEEL